MKSVFYKILVISFLLASSFAASAQVYIGGAVGGAYANSPNTSTKSRAVSIKPEAGYILNGNWAFGGRITYGKSESKIESPYLHQTDIDIKPFTINPYAAYSPLRFGDFAVWAEFGLQIAPKQDGVDYSTIAVYATPVLTYDLGEHFILKTNLNFAGLSVTKTTDGGFAISGAFGGDNALSLNDLSIGFVYRF